MNTPNINEKTMSQEIPSQSQPLSQTEVLSLLKEDKYNEAITSLTHSQSSPNSEYETSNNWNIFLIKLLKEAHSAQSFSSELIQSITSFFSQIDTSMKTSLPVINLDEILFSFTLGQYATVIGKYKRNVIQSSCDYILFVNATVMLIEVCFLFNFNSFAGQFIMCLENYFESTATSLSHQGQQDCRTIDKITMSFYNNDRALAYYNSNEIYHKDCNMNKELIFLLKCQLHLNQFQGEKAKKLLTDFKSIYSMSQMKKSFPLYERLKRMYNILKIKLDYLNNSQFKCYKHLNTLSSNYSDQEMLLFKYNSYGLLNLRLKKVKYAEFYFMEALLIAKSHQRLLIKYSLSIYFNLALCSFYSTEYDKCYSRLMSIKENEVMKSNPFYYYRLGLCLVEREFKKNKQLDNRHNDTVKSFIRYPPIYPHIEGGFDEEGNRLGLRSRFYKMFTETKDNKDEDKGNNPTNMNKGIALNNKSDKGNFSMIKEAIDCFKRCILLLKGYNVLKQELNQINLKVNTEEREKGQVKLTNNKRTKDNSYSKENYCSFNHFLALPTLSESDTKRSHNKIYSSSISHLLFCLLLTSNYTEVIFYGTKYLNDISLKKEHHLITNYLAEAYIYLGQIANALSILLSTNNLSDTRGSIYSKNSNVLYSDAQYQIALRLNIIKVHFLQGDLPEVEKGISQLLKAIRKDELPSYIANTLLYYYLYTKKHKEAIDLILYRKIYEK